MHWLQVVGRSEGRPWQSGQYAERPSSTWTTATTCSSGSPRWCSTRWTANGLEVDDFISVIFTATSDLVSEFPAYAARQLGFGDVPLICARELEIEGSMPRVVRMLAHVETDLPRADITHVYLHGAAALRSDLTRVRSVPDDESASSTGPVEVVGTGLLGTSIGLALRRAGLEVVLTDASPDHLRTASGTGRRPAAHRRRPAAAGRRRGPARPPRRRDRRAR